MMKKLLFLFTFLIAGSVALRAQTIATGIAATPQLSTLNTALQASGLDETLNGEGPFTVFAPNNASFNALPPNMLNAFLSDPEGVLTDILLHHVVEGTVLAADLNDGEFVTTLFGQQVQVTVTETVTVGNATVLNADNALTNGVVHLVNAVIIPETTTIFDVVAESDVHNTLQTALEASGLDEALSGPGGFTLFAPTDEAFDNLEEGVLDALLADPEGALTTILEYHVTGSAVLAANLSDGLTIETLEGRSLTVTIDGENVMIDDAMVTIADIVAVNGIVHVIDAVLIPEDPPTIMDRLQNTGVHNLLITALEAAGLDEVLSEPGDYTLFAPTDAAFNELPENLLNALLTDPEGVLSDILLYHVAGEVFLAADLFDGQVISSLLGQNVEVDLTGPSAVLNGSAAITLTDFEGSNGVMHILDGILIPETTTVADIVEGSEVHETLWTALQAAELDETLAGAGTFTLFAPTDDAFNNLPEGVLDDLLADPTGDLADILLSHVLGNIVLSDDLEEGQTGETLSGTTVEFTTDGEDLFVDGIQITVANLVGINGVVHVIDAIIGVEIEEFPTINEIVAESEVHNTLQAALEAAGLDTTLDGEGDFTLFAPTDDAFALLPEGLTEALLTDPEGVLTQILLYHVVGESAFAGDLSDGQVIATLAEQDITIQIDEENVFINNALVTAADIQASNGVVHVIDAVLIPEATTVFDAVAASEVHETLQAALEASGLDETLSSAGAFTLFAPTDEAFDNLPEGVLDDLLADPEGALTEILLYHTVSGIALSENLEDGQEILTLNGESLTVAITGEGVFINGAQVTIADIITVNGVVHVIDAVLQPAAELPTIFEIVAESEVHNTLQAALEAAGLDATLEGEGDFTLFAPDDNAFAALPPNLVNALLADPEFAVLTDVLLYHVLGAGVFAETLVDGQEAETLLGQDITISINEDGVFINDALVTLTDIEASNGVVHVISAVLIPETTTIFDLVAGSPTHETLTAALEASGLDETLSGPGTFTLFAPTDEAFNALPDGVLQSLLDDPDGQLTAVLLNHVTDEILLSTDLSDGQQIGMLNGEDLGISITAEGIFADDAEIILTNVVGINGVIHFLDLVLTASIVGVEDVTSVNAFKAFPNPAASVLNVSIDVKTNERVFIRIADITGRIVQSADLGSVYGLNQTDFDVSKLPAGMYILDVNVGGERFSHKVQIAR